MGIDAMIVHVAFGAGDEESTCGGRCQFRLEVIAASYGVAKRGGWRRSLPPAVRRERWIRHNCESKTPRGRDTKESF
jgi:hypothetical protein